MPPPRFHHEPVLVDPQIAPPYTDLAITRIDTQVDHDNRLISAATVIDNLGGEPPSVPFCVYTVVLTYVHGELKEVHEWRWYGTGHSGFPFRTLWTNSPLYYAQEGGDGYEVHVVVDSEESVVDRNRRNNIDFLYCPPFFKPNLFNADSEQPLRQEVTIENGKRKSKLTIGGKPLKK